MKPVLYLDVDGVLWDIVEGDADRANRIPKWAGPARGLEEFLDYAFKTFEVRWCTTWAMGGSMHPDMMERLYGHTGVPVETWAKVQPSFGWYDLKSENVDWVEHRAGREFAWVEDALFESELQMLEDNGFHDSYYYTDVFEDSDALVKTLAKLKERFGEFDEPKPAQSSSLRSMTNE